MFVAEGVVISRRLFLVAELESRCGDSTVIGAMVVVVAVGGGGFWGVVVCEVGGVISFVCGVSLVGGVVSFFFL